MMASAKNVNHPNRTRMKQSSVDILQTLRVYTHPPHIGMCTASAFGQFPINAAGFALNHRNISTSSGDEFIVCQESDLERLAILWAAGTE
jgi:hypothetical protein